MASDKNVMVFSVNMHDSAKFRSFVDSNILWGKCFKTPESEAKI